MLWLRYGILRGKSLRDVLHESLESPGTKSFTEDEVQRMLAGFDEVHMRQVFSPGDLLLHQPSLRFQGPAFRLARTLYPRKLVRAFGKRYGLFLLVSARKVRAVA